MLAASQKVDSSARSASAARAGAVERRNAPVSASAVTFDMGRGDVSNDGSHYPLSVTAATFGRLKPRKRSRRVEARVFSERFFWTHAMTPRFRHQPYVARRANLSQAGAIAENQNKCQIPRRPASMQRGVSRSSRT